MVHMRSVDHGMYSLLIRRRLSFAFLHDVHCLYFMSWKTKLRYGRASCFAPTRGDALSLAWQLHGLRLLAVKL